MGAPIQASSATKVSQPRRFPRFGTRSSSDGQAIIRPVSLVIEAGRILCVGGAVGSGKTALLQLLSGRTEPSDGTVLIYGYDTKTQARMARGFVSYVVANESKVSERAPGEALLRKAVVNAESGERVDRTIEILGLDSVLERTPDTYSSGERRCFEIALATLSTPVVVIDDLFSITDGAAAESVTQLLRTYARSWAGTVVFSTKHIEMAQALADDVLILSEGQPVLYGPPAEVLPERRPPGISVRFLGASAVALASNGGNGHGGLTEGADQATAHLVVEGESKFLELFRRILSPSP